MKKTTGSRGQVFALFLAVAAAASTASAVTPGSVCREQTVFQSRSGIHAFSGDDSNLYLGLANGKLQRISTSDFTATDLDTAGAPITQMTLDANSIYYATTGVENSTLHHQIFSISKQGGSPQLIADITDGVGAMTNDSGFVYWLVPSSTPTTADGKIERVSKTGGTVHTITSNLAIPTALAVDSTNVYFTEEGVSQQPPYGLSKVPLGGGTAVRLAGTKPGEGIAGVSNGLVYFQAREDLHDNGLYSIPIGGASSPSPLHTPLFAPTEIQQIADGRFFYSVGYNDWTLGNVGGLTVFDTSGNTIVLSTEQISSFANDQSAIYALFGLGFGERIDRFCLNYATAPHVTKVGADVSASGGTPLTITGSNFQAGAQVTFGGTQGNVQSVTPTTIQVTAPAHAAGIFDLYVINPDGESGRSQVYFDPRLPGQLLRKHALDHH